MAKEPCTTKIRTDAGNHHDLPLQAWRNVSRKTDLREWSDLDQRQKKKEKYRGKGKDAPK